MFFILADSGQSNEISREPFEKKKRNETGEVLHFGRFVSFRFTASWKPFPFVSFRFVSFRVVTVRCVWLSKKGGVGPTNSIYFDTKFRIKRESDQLICTRNDMENPMLNFTRPPETTIIIQMEPKVNFYNRISRLGFGRCYSADYLIIRQLSSKWNQN